MLFGKKFLIAFFALVFFSVIVAAQPFGFCGDGICDFEQSENCGTCPVDCSICGNNLVECSEACDDGGTVNGDGCSAVCTVESGWACSGQPSSCHSIVCSDGIVDNPPEECDNGASNSDSVADACRSSVCPSGGQVCCNAWCGDNVTDTGEQCDNGASNSDSVADACRTTCVLPGCGDSVIDAGEACDDGNNIDGDGCSATCLLEECGNGIVDPGEGCDDGLNNSDTTPDACRTTCVLPGCGDSVIDAGEACDDGNTVSGDGCSGDCSKIEFCPNGVLDAGEQCDDGNLINGDGCSSTCQIVPVQACFDVWEKKFGDTDNEIGYSVKQTFDCSKEIDIPGGTECTTPTPTGYIITGQNLTTALAGQVWLIKTDESGESCSPDSTETCYNSESQFIRAFGGSGPDKGRSVIQYFGQNGGVANGYVIAGTFFNTIGGNLNDIYIIKTDKSGLTSGNTYWKTAWGGLGDDEGFSVSQRQSDFLVTGIDSDAASVKLLSLARFNSAGIPLFNTTPKLFRFGDFAGGYSDSNEFAAVGFDQTGSNRDLWVINTDISGDTCDFTSGNCFESPDRFVHIFSNGTSGTEEGWSIKKTFDGGYVIAGVTDSFGAGGNDVWMIKIAKDGKIGDCDYSVNGNCSDSIEPTKMFARTFGGSLNDVAYSVDQTLDGGYIMVGETDSFGAGGKDLWVIKTDEFGDTCTIGSDGTCSDSVEPSKRFANTFGGVGDDVGYEIVEAVDAAGNSNGFVMTGFSKDTVGGDSDLWLLKIDVFGNGPLPYSVCGVCGNGFPEAWLGEECDDGKNGVATDLCTDNCKVTFCGDAILQSPDGNGFKEQCDNGRFCDDFTACTVDVDCTGVGSGKCELKSASGCDLTCQEQFTGLKIEKIIFNPDTLVLNNDVTDFKVVIDSSEVGQANIVVTVRDVVTGKVLNTSNISYALLLGSQTVDLKNNPDFASLPLEAGSSYRVSVDVDVFVGKTLKANKSIFFTILSGEIDLTNVPVPEFNVLLLPLLLFIVIGLLWKK